MTIAIELDVPFDVVDEMTQGSVVVPAALEDELGVRLMQRTTRSVSLTPEGEAVLPFAATMLEAAEAGRAVIAPSTSGATGLLRVTATASFGRTIIMPLIPQLLAENPGLHIDLLLTDTMVDIVSTGVGGDPDCDASGFEPHRHVAWAQPESPLRRSRLPVSAGTAQAIRRPRRPRLRHTDWRYAMAFRR